MSWQVWTGGGPPDRPLVAFFTLCHVWACECCGFVFGRTRVSASHVLDRGEDAGAIGKAVAAELLATFDSGGCVDEYLQDQLIIFMALAAGPLPMCTEKATLSSVPLVLFDCRGAAGRSSVRCGPLSLHTKTSIFIAGSFTGARFAVEEVPGGAVIACDGVGFVSSHGAAGAGDSATSTCAVGVAGAGSAV